MSVFYLQPNDPIARKIASICFPDYNGKKFSVQTCESGMNLHSYWDGGNRTYYTILKLDDMTPVSIPQNGTMFDKVNYGEQKVFPCPNFAVVAHSIFCGSDAGITVYLHPENGSFLLPAPKEISKNEKIVLVATKCYKSSYAGIKDYRYEEAHKKTGISREDWLNAKLSCTDKRLLNKTGVITSDGRNAVSGVHNLYHI